MIDSIILKPDFIITGLSCITFIILGILVYVQNTRSATNIFFSLFCISAAFWGVFNYLSYTYISQEYGLQLVRMVMFFAIPLSLFFYFLMKTYPQSFVTKSRINIPLVISSFIIMILTQTKYIFNSIANDGDVIPHTIPGTFLPLFGLFTVGLIISGIFTILRKRLLATKEKVEQYNYLIVGVITMFLLIVVFNFVLPAFFNKTNFIPLAPVFLLPFIFYTSFAIIKFQLFNVKTIATELIVFILWIVLFIRTIIAHTTDDQIINGFVFFITVIVGILLIKSVFKEVKQKEKLEILTKELESANEKLKSLDKLKTEFLSLASHQLRSPLTAIKGYTSMLLEGSFGEVNATQKEAIDRVFQSVQHLTKVVEDLLNVSKIEQGGMKYEMAPFDLAKNVKEIATDLSITAKNKGLTLTYESDSADSYVVNGDMEKIRQVILNLIDNSIKYTKEGWIKVKIENDQTKKVIRTSVSDSGMGMTEEIKNSLFQKFSRGEGGKVNTGGSGLGLYLAKQIVEAHKGRVWVESPGPGKGSTFIVEFPIGIN